MQCRGAKSFVDDLGLSRGVVFSRAAALLRSIETKPFDSEICPLWTDVSPVVSWFVLAQAFGQHRALLASSGRLGEPFFFGFFSQSPHLAEILTQSKVVVGLSC